MGNMKRASSGMAGEQLIGRVARMRISLTQNRGYQPNTLQLGICSNSIFLFRIGEMAPLLIAFSALSIFSGDVLRGGPGVVEGARRCSPRHGELRPQGPLPRMLRRHSFARRNRVHGAIALSN